jgi:hypothetical protein
MQVKAFFPTEVAAKEVDPFKMLRAAPFYMKKVYHFRDSQELRVCSSCKDRVTVAEYGAHVHGRSTPVYSNGGYPQHSVSSQKGQHAVKTIHEPGIVKVG